MNARFIDWIWHVRGRLPLAPAQSSEEAFASLAPLFQDTGTSYERTDDRLIFRKKNQAAQDKMSVFDDGILRIENGAGGPFLRYHLTSRALLFCFLAPLLFLGFAELTIAIGKFQKPTAEKTADKSGKASSAENKAAAKKAEVPMNPIDKALGAPAPDKKKDGADMGGGGKKKKPSPTYAYVFAGIFAALYVIGRILEDRLVRRLFDKLLKESAVHEK